MLRERWPPWKVGLYGSEVVSLREHCFRPSGLVYNTSTRKIGVGETERRGSKGISREEKGRKGQEEETEKGEGDRSKEGGRGMGNME